MHTARRSIIHFIVLIAAIFTLVAIEPLARADDLDKAVRLAKQYLRSNDADQRQSLAGKLARYDDQWERIVIALQTQTYGDAKPGYYGAEHFTQSALLKKHPDDLLYIIVPQNYRSEQATGLIVFMHGGGKGSPRTSPARYMRPDNPTEAFIGDIFEQTGMIGVAPSAPWNPNDHSRWTLPETDDYIADVITECSVRFNIAPNRVFLWGHSMGGFGGFQQVQRQPDRFAAVIASAGSWTLAQWPVIRSTTFCIVHGTRDAERGVRDRHTDIEFAKQAHLLLTKQRIPHIYKEHDGAHPVADAKPSVLEFLQENPTLVRNPYPRQVAVASPVGFRMNKCFPKKHSYWLSLNETVEDSELEYDSLVVSTKGHSKNSSLADWNEWTLTHKKENRPGAMIEATNRGDNRFEVTTTGVSRFTLWLHPAMVDFNKPVELTVNKALQIEQSVTPNCATMLDSFARRHDWKLVYPAKMIVQVTD
jgi:poly(3-hydroxybutyrate) depolymerase